MVELIDWFLLNITINKYKKNLSGKEMLFLCNTTESLNWSKMKNTHTDRKRNSRLKCLNRKKFIPYEFEWNTHTELILFLFIYIFLKKRSLTMVQRFLQFRLFHVYSQISLRQIGFFFVVDHLFFLSSSSSSSSFTEILSIIIVMFVCIFFFFCSTTILQSM